MEFNSLTILGLIAAFCTAFSFLPQVIKTIRTKNTRDLSLGMYSVFSLGILLWLVYGLLIRDIPLILANTITLMLAVTILFLKIKYP